MTYDSEMLKQMKLLRYCLANDLRGVSLQEDTDLFGFKLISWDTKETLYTAYVSADGGFSSYVAIRDMEKGLDCADEKPLAENVPLFTAVAKIKTHQITYGFGGLYPNPMPVNSNPQRAPHYLSD